jgi:hypothetical protein
MLYGYHCTSSHPSPGHIRAVPAAIPAEGDDHHEPGLGACGRRESGSSAEPSLMTGGGWYRCGGGGGGGVVADAGVGAGVGGKMTVDARICV